MLLIKEQKVIIKFKIFCKCFSWTRQKMPFSRESILVDGNAALFLRSIKRWPQMLLKYCLMQPISLTINKNKTVSSFYKMPVSLPTHPINSEHIAHGPGDLMLLLITFVPSTKYPVNCFTWTILLTLPKPYQTDFIILPAYTAYIVKDPPK